MNPNEQASSQETLYTNTQKAVESTKKVLLEKIGSELSPEKQVDVNAFIKHLEFFDEIEPDGIRQVGSMVEATLKTPSGVREYVITSEKPVQDDDNEVRNLYINYSGGGASDTFELKAGQDTLSLSRIRVDNQKIEGSSFIHEHIL